MADQTDPTLAPTVESSTPVPDAPPAATDYQAYKASRVAPAPAPEAVTSAPAPVEAAAPPPETTTEPEPEPEPDETPDEPPKSGDTRTPTQKRIDKAVRAQREAERREVAAREKAARLEGELAAIKSGQAKSVSVETPTQAVATAAAMPDNPADPKPVIDQFDSYEAGIEALAAWKARQEYRTLRAQETEAAARVAAQTAHQERLQAYFARLDAFKQSTPDFDQLVNNPSANLPVSPAVSSLIVESPVGPAISYYLAQHPDECQAIYALDERSAAKALGKIEATLEMRSAPTAPAAPPKPMSHAPAPITPVAGARVAAPTLNTHTYADYKRARLAGKL